MRIGEIAHRSGLSRDTIRFYERNGLIDSTPGSGSTNSYRDYNEDLVERLQMIREAQAAGFTIADLFLFIRQLENAAHKEFDADAFLDRKIVEIENNMERSQRFLKTLRATKLALSGGRSECSTARRNSASTSADSFT